MRFINNLTLRQKVIINVTAFAVIAVVLCFSVRTAVRLSLPEAFAGGEGAGLGMKEEQALSNTQPAPAVKPENPAPVENNQWEEVQTPRDLSNMASAKRAIEYDTREGFQQVPTAARVQAKAFFAYSPTGIYEIYCHSAHLTDIQLQTGEDILYIGGGDTARWQVDKAQSGPVNQRQWHIYVKPLRDGIVTNFMITTDRRAYQIRAKAASFYNPIIGWTYPYDDKAAFMRAQAERKKKEDEEISSHVSPEKMNFNYTISEKSGIFGGSYSWTPNMVFDDGAKTYIRMAEGMKTTEAPALFVKDDSDNIALVNYRVKNNYYIVDRLFSQAELRNGTKEIVVIKKTN